MKQRYWLIDFLRVFAISLVIFQHIIARMYVDWPWIQPFNLNYNVGGVFLLEWGAIGVSIFFFVSGCSLALSQRDKKMGVWVFYGNRMLRIYPVFWVACLFGLATMPERSALFTPVSYVANFLGFTAFGAHNFDEWAGFINGAYWFIGVLVVLYLLFPLLLWAIKKHPHISIVSLLGVSVASRFLMAYVFTEFYRGIDWFPLCQVFTFGLGIYLVTVNKLPKMETHSRSLMWLGPLSFFAYLVHAPLLPLIEFNNVVAFAVSLAVFTLGLYLLDCWMKKRIRRLFSKFQKQDKV
jgi:peptidoglycan/LPS O-acetylase OafA/YrhL